ncbi:phosphoribosylglycinamide formyltransferase [Rhodococcus sp. IEGM 1408]|uniref:phosphoribosylglycinamide formyltransferase n=1 Tax=Rhodococcus sp. IEGM 1408 TaxID=3082220 RepID=UPI0029547DC5|nr:phosphoribosylglycinamide formyltransferase [Rhodococcus sp. IEGM 1408]MDV8001151.1 phosphoribosylglycinamide formyltransferase [Rhodococcus sp. IEGM 1408]
MDSAESGVARPVVLLASGAGTLAQSVLDSAAVPDCPYRIIALVSDRDCEAVARAARAGLATAVVRPADHPDRPSWDRALTDTVRAFDPSWVVSAGFMRILGGAFLGEFAGRVINTHPALLPSFPGAHAVRDALAYGVTVTGCTVHLVDSGVDTGPVIAQRAVDVLVDDTESTLHERIKVVEREMLVDILAAAARGRLHIEGRKVVRS